VTKIGRNETCPCGSGAKYKKCCLLASEAQKVNEMLTSRDEQSRQTAGKDAHEHCPLCRDILYEMEDDPLGELANDVLNMIHEDRFEEALALAQKILLDYPEVIDGSHLTAIVYEKSGQFALAAEWYRKTLALSEQPDQKDHFDEEFRGELKDDIAQMEALLKSAPTNEVSA